MKFLLKIILSLAFTLAPLITLAAPDIPHQFYGTVNFSNGPAPDGLTVEAKTSTGVVVGVSTIKDGKYGYSPNVFFVTDDNDGTSKDMIPGQEIKFFVNGIDTGTTASFLNNGYNEKNLELSSAIGTIIKSETDVITDQTIAVSPQSETNIKMGDNNLNITISSAANTSAIIEKIEKKSSGNVAVFSGKNFLNAYEIKITGENINITVTMKYDDSGINEDTIAPYRFDGASWVAITSFTIDKTANTITFSISSGQTVYGIFGSTAQAATTGGGGGGGLIAQTTPPSTTPLSEAAKKMDTNQDDKIDILDFNSLMVNWGRQESDNIADFDANGAVDIFDFNLLMIYWTG